MMENFTTGVSLEEAGILKHHYDCVAARWDHETNRKEILDARVKAGYWQQVTQVIKSS